MDQVELLAPAGSFEAMKAAANAGCDAVYIGGSRFGARAYANNLAKDDMLAAIDYMHLRGKKIYMTVNTLLKEAELAELCGYIEPYYKRGLDAVIVQDMGVLSTLHAEFPELPLHASTQMTLTMAEGADLLKQYGVTRLVPARELTLPEIIRMRKDTDLEIETFVHGALCYCYSGQCLMSSLLGGRSGNRGRCAQPCRMEYLVDKLQSSAGKETAGNRRGMTKKGSNSSTHYLLSPKDICTLEILPELMESGINSFKIEGRMKRSEYTAGVTAIYRKYMDLYEQLGGTDYRNYVKSHRAMFEEDMSRLMDLYNRGGFSGGYYKTAKGPAMMAMDRPNHTGVFVGTVTKMAGIRADIKLVKPVLPGDVLEIRGGAEDYSFTVGGGKAVAAGGVLSTNFSKEAGVRPDLSVYRTKNEALLRELASAYMEKEKKQSICGSVSAFVGEPTKFTLRKQDVSVTVIGPVPQEAKSRPVTAEKIKEQILKTGDTPFVFSDLAVDAGDNLFLPLQQLNELRREGIAELERAILAGYERKELREEKLAGKNMSADSVGSEGKNAPTVKEELAEEKVPTGRTEFVNGAELCLEAEEKTFGTAFSISAVVMTIPQLTQALSSGIKQIYLDTDGFARSTIPAAIQDIHAAGASAYIRLPHIFRASTFDAWEKFAPELIQAHPDGFLLRSYEEIAYLKKYPEFAGLPMIADYQLYVMNHASMSAMQKYGFTGFTTPVELNNSELKDLNLTNGTAVVYGRLPLMTSSQCVYRNTCGCKKGEEAILALTDRMGKKFPVFKQCEDCYNTIYNALPLALFDSAEEFAMLGVNKVRLDFTTETADQTRSVIDLAKKGTVCTGEMQAVIGEYTRGHFKRGIQ